MATKKAPSKRKPSLNRSARFSTSQLLIFMGVFIFLGAIIVLKSFAATSSGGVGSISLNEANPYLGSLVTFTTTYSKLPGGVSPRIEVMCYQDVNGDGTINTSANTDLVWATAVTDPAYTKNNSTVSSDILLGGASSGWHTRGGVATCIAKTFYFTYKGGQQYGHMLASTPLWIAGPAR